MNRCTYVLAGNASTRQIPSSPLPQNLSSLMKDLFTEQEKERHRLRLQVGLVYSIKFYKLALNF